MEMVRNNELEVSEKWLATKKEAQAQLDAARTKASQAATALSSVRLDHSMLMPGDGVPDIDAAKLHYDRCVAELAEAINDMADFETGDE